MCGITAIFAYHDAALEVDREELGRIRDRMASRGPDGAGEWFSTDGRVALGHRRLAVIDLSKEAAQPMASDEGEMVVSFNGEIYNYQEIRSGLQARGHRFHSHSDTEVLLHLYQEKGEAMVHDLRGMFAFVLWDARKRILFLARDPYGIKPLYYADDGWTVRVASQVKALLAGEKVSRLPEPAGIVGFFLMGSVPEPYTTYQEIRQVPAGCTMIVNETGPQEPKRYFSIAGSFDGRKKAPDGKDAVREALLDSVRHHFVSDVPVGIFLSSGIDSGSLAGLAVEAGIKRLETVTLAFQEFQGRPWDEAPLAEIVAQHYGIRHSTRLVRKEEFLEELPRIFEAMDQPSIDGINTYFVSKAAAERGWKAALSGVGGDELFGGYPSFWEIPRLVRRLRIPSRIPFLAELFRHFFPRSLAQRSGYSPKYAGVLKYGGNYAGAYFLKRGLFMPWELESVLDREVLREGQRRLSLFRQIKEAMEPDPGTPFGRVATLEASFYLKNQLLRDADWAGMAYSLEIRTPFVDVWLLKALAPFLAAGSERQRGLKTLLAESLTKPLPVSVTQRQKTGFAFPLAHWLGEKKDGSWAREWARQVMERQKGISQGLVGVGHG